MQLDLLFNEPCVPAEPEKAASSMTAHVTEAASLIETTSGGEEKSPGAFKTIGEAAELLGVPQHVLRFWEVKFKQIKPLKLRGGRRYYRPEDMEILAAVKNLLYKQGYTIRGARKALAANNPQPAHETGEKQSVSTDKHQALASIRQELIILRDALKPHIF